MVSSYGNQNILWCEYNDLGFLMMLPQAAALITSGITKILHGEKNIQRVCYGSVYRLNFCVSMYFVFVPVDFHHVLVCLSWVSDQSIDGCLLVIREDGWHWTSCGCPVV